MRTILKAKWLVIIVWILALAGLIFTAPNMGDLVREEGQPEVPEGYSSSIAADILEEMHEREGSADTSATALVFHNENGLTDSDFKEAEQAIQTLENHKEELGIESVTSHFDEPDLEDELVSEDGTTILASVEIHIGDRSTTDVKEALYDTLDNTELNHYFTGNWLIQEDYITSTQDGLKKTEWITVIFILTVLLIVFRSFITPFIPLVTVGITYLASQSIVAFLVDWFGFPLSNFTQIFLVAVLFGIGTDYCILLLNRFKEEIPKHETITDAVVHTYKHGGRTMFFSAIAVLVGFSTIGLSTFSLYRSAVGVAVGIAILIIALVTIVPILMELLGTKLFWPSKKSLQHNESKLWGAVGNFALIRPLISLLIVAAVTVPFILTFDDKITYNSLEEISDDYKSVKAFDIISDSLGPGESMPTTIVMKNDEKLNKRKYLETIEAVTREVKTVDHVKTVRSVTQPTGEPIEDFLVPNQAQTLDEGLADANDGIDQIRDGLAEARDQLVDNEPQLQEAIDSFDPLISGTKDLKSGVNELKEGLQTIQDGMEDSSSGAAELKEGLQQAKQGAEELAQGSQQLLKGYQGAESNLKKISNSLDDLAGNFKEQINNAKRSVEQLAKAYPQIQAHDSYTELLRALNAMSNNDPEMPDLLTGLQQASGGVTKIQQGLKEANENFDKVVQSQQQFASEMQQIVDGITELQQGLNQLASGQQEAVGNIPQISNGLGDINDGQSQLQSGFSEMVDQIGELTGGLDESVEGLNDISDGLEDARDFLNELSETNSSLAGFYIPDQALESEDFKEAMDAYMSEDRKITTIDVVFNVNPYATEAIDEIDAIQAAVDRATKDSPMENAEVGIGGATSMYHDLRDISNEDYTRTVVLMLIGIGLILIALLRSFIMPIYILLSLVVTYYTAMGITEFIYVNLFDYSGLNWAVPFFGFVVLIALGVDYSIFLMDRFNENRDLSVTEAILSAMKNMGTVIISAAIILGGTFASMMPSGVMALVEIATIVISGLVMYNIFMLPLYTPVMVKMFGEANWWPFKRTED